MSIRYVGALIIQAVSPKHLADWYTKHLDFKISLEHVGGYFGAFETERGPFHFGITPYQGDTSISLPGPVIVTFRVDSFEKYIRRMKKSGMEPISIAEDDEGRYAMFRDPEGNQVSIWGE